MFLFSLLSALHCFCGFSEGTTTSIQRVMVEEFNSDDENFFRYDENFFHNGRRDTNDGCRLAAAAAADGDGDGSLIEIYDNSGFGSCETSSSFVSAYANRCFYDCMLFFFLSISIFLFSCS